MRRAGNTGIQRLAIITLAMLLRYVGLQKQDVLAA